MWYNIREGNIMNTNFKIHFLNTIWSDSMLLESEDHYAFVDCASKFYYPMIQDYLNKKNIKTIDFILLTHFIMIIMEILQVL